MPEREVVELAWVASKRGASGLTGRLGWYVNRLRCMTPAELSYRALRSASIHAERWGLARRAGAPPAHLAVWPRPWFHLPASPEAEACVHAAERIAAGRYDLFALTGVELGTPPRWNRDPKTGVEAPLRFGKLLNYRDPSLVGDIKYVWELNRHQHIVTLAQAYAVTREPRYFEVIREHLESWFSACPCPLGPNWSSALEPALRLISWSTAWQMLGGGAAPLFTEPGNAGFRDRWLSSIFEHARFIHGYFSLYSSANNHLIGEAAGLFIAATTWPCWPHAGMWRSDAKRILERETLLQNAADGVNREQAVAYQRFELELLLLCWLAAEVNGETFTADFRSRIEAMLEYLASIMDVTGNVPMIGDSDDAITVRLDHRAECCSYRALLATGALLFRRADFKLKAGALDERTRWLIADADRAFDALDTSRVRLPARQAFPEGGYYVLGCDFETENEIRLVADAGALGYQTIAAHGHADALAFSLSVGGVEFFVDAGTCAYHTNVAWRDYFRGTAAHNTVRVDGVDQSQSGGNFMWVKKARAGCTHWSGDAEQDVFEGWHDGYLRLADPVLHRRRITLAKRVRRIVIEDTLEMTGAHTIELHLHCSERCLVVADAHGYTVESGAKRIRVTLPRMEAAEYGVHRGRVTPILGWISRRFDERHPAPTIAWRCRITGRAVLRTEIAC